MQNEYSENVNDKFDSIDSEENRQYCYALNVSRVALISSKDQKEKTRQEQKIL